MYQHRSACHRGSWRDGLESCHVPRAVRLPLLHQGALPAPRRRPRSCLRPAPSPATPVARLERGDLVGAKAAGTGLGRPAARLYEATMGPASNIGAPHRAIAAPGPETARVKESLRSPISRSMAAPAKSRYTALTQSQCRPISHAKRFACPFHQFEPHWMTCRTHYSVSLSGPLAGELPRPGGDAVIESASL